MSLSPEEMYRKLQEDWNAHIGRQLRYIRRIRWFVLAVNLIPAALHLSRATSVAAYFIAFGHLVIGVGLFWFLTKRHHQAVRDYAAMKLRKASG